MRPRLKISQRSYPSQEEPTINNQTYIENIVEPISMIEEEVLNYHMGEEIMSNSCIVPEVEDIESKREIEEKSILDEPMVAKALELFAPKKVRVKRKS